MNELYEKKVKINLNILTPCNCLKIDVTSLCDN